MRKISTAKTPDGSLVTAGEAEAGSVNYCPHAVNRFACTSSKFYTDQLITSRTSKQTLAVPCSGKNEERSLILNDAEA